MAGLVIAAILAAAMSNLSAALNSLASTTIMDFYKPSGSRADRRTEAHYLRLARLATIVWGVVLFAIGAGGAALGLGAAKPGSRSPRSSTARCWACSCSGC